MKSKLFLGSSLLLVWLSSCTDPETSGTTADAGVSDGGKSTVSSDGFSDSGAGGETSASSASDTSAHLSSDASPGVSGDAGNTQSNGLSTTAEASDAGTPASDSGGSQTDASTPTTDAGDEKSDASTNGEASTETTGLDASANDDAGSSEGTSSNENTATVVEEDAGPAAPDAGSGPSETSLTNDTASSDGTSGEESNESDTIRLDAGDDARVDAETPDASEASDASTSIDAGTVSAPDANTEVTTDTGTSAQTDASTSTDATTDTSDESTNTTTDVSTSSDSATSDTTSTDTSSIDATSSSDTSSDVPLDGRQLFEEATFDGNGRTCLTCHGPVSGSISPQEIQALFASNPNDPMFRPIDSNDGVGSDYSILLERATFRVELALPPGVTLVSDPTATTIVLRRSALSTINTPGLDPTLMWDGRATDLMDQASGAITGHAESPITPAQEQLELIAEFEQTDAFFSSDTLRNYFDGGPAPQWPPGNTASEIRGRRWFAEDPTNAPRFNICGQCHGGPMSNETQQNSGLPVGEHFQTANVSEFNTKGNPTYQFRFPDPNNPGQTVVVTTPDPGLALTTGDVRDVNFFKIPTLWGVSRTAPYFHDNSAATLEELMDHYEDHLATFLFSGFPWPFPHVPTAQDKADIVAYMRLL